jgi:hypothetical protein
VPEEIEVEEIDAETVPVGEEAAEAMAQEEMDAAADVDAAAASDDDEAAAEGDEELVPRALVLSGWVSKPDALAGKPAILDLPSGRGRVILYAFNPLHRYLNHSDFRFLYNALLNWNDLP